MGYSSVFFLSRKPDLKIVSIVGGQAVFGRQLIKATPWLTERHGYDPT